MTEPVQKNDEIFHVQAGESAFVAVFKGYLCGNLHPILMNCSLELRARLLIDALTTDLERGIDPIAEWRAFEE